MRPPSRKRAAWLSRRHAGGDRLDSTGPAGSSIYTAVASFVDVEALRLMRVVQRRLRGATLSDPLAGMPAAIRIFAHPMIRAVESAAEKVSRQGGAFTSP